MSAKKYVKKLRLISNTCGLCIDCLKNFKYCQHVFDMLGAS